MCGSVVMGILLIIHDFPFLSGKVRYNDLKLYEERTDPDGPAMTHSMFAIGWLDIGDKKRAERPFVKNYANIRGPFKVISTCLMSILAYCELL